MLPVRYRGGRGIRPLLEAGVNREFGFRDHRPGDPTAVGVRRLWPTVLCESPPTQAHKIS